MGEATGGGCREMDEAAIEVETSDETTETDGLVDGLDQAPAALSPTAQAQALIQ